MLKNILFFPDMKNMPDYAIFSSQSFPLSLWTYITYLWYLVVQGKMQPLLIAIIFIIIYFKYFIFGFILFSFHLKIQKKLSLHSGICFFLNIYWCIVIADSDTSISSTLEILFVQLFNASNLYRCAFLRLL